MGKIIKKFIALLVIQFLILLLIPTLAMADSSNDSNISCRLSVISPDSNIPYNNTLPLNINIAWTANTVVPFMYFNISYAIDDSSKISIAQGNNPSFNSTAQGTALHYEYLVFPPSTTNTAITIDIPTLTNGAHKITIFADGEYNLNNDFINPYHYTSSAIYFSVNYLAVYPTASPSPTLTPTPTLTPSPSPPEFTAKFVASSIEVTIKNQPITAYVDTNGSNPSLYYGFRFKDHENIQDWNYAPIYYVGSSSYGTYYKSSASDYTVVSFPFGSYPLTGILGSGQVDLQVMAHIGNEVPTNYENGTVYGFDGVESVWSNTQTITIPISSSSPTATPTTSIQGWVAAVTLVVVLAVAAGLLVYLKKRRPKSGGKT
jgi:hypothetical protein